jgi:hypothetical protein
MAIDSKSGDIGSKNTFEKIFSEWGVFGSKSWL